MFFGESKFKYRGLIRIEKQAQHANAFQQQNNLLLSNKSSIDTKPELEIKANEVRCTHASTTSTIGEEQLYYLMSRGISGQDARSLIVEGFIDDVLRRINDKLIQEQVVKQLARS